MTEANQNDCFAFQNTHARYAVGNTDATITGLNSSGSEPYSNKRISPSDKVPPSGIEGYSMPPVSIISGGTPGSALYGRFTYRMKSHR